MRVSKHGIPIMGEREKLVALAYCMAQEHYEDAAGHLCDLLERCRNKINVSVGALPLDTSQIAFKSLAEMVEHYGKHPTEIEDGQTH